MHWKIRTWLASYNKEVGDEKEVNNKKQKVTRADSQICCIWICLTDAKLMKVKQINNSYNAVKEKKHSRLRKSLKYIFSRIRIYFRVSRSYGIRIGVLISYASKWFSSFFSENGYRLNYQIHRYHISVSGCLEFQFAI